MTPSLFTRLERMLGLLLLDAEGDPLRASRLQAVAELVLAQTPPRHEPLLFALFQRKARVSERYGIEHPLSCALVAHLAALQLGWPLEERRALVSAALTMNISIAALQCELAHRERPLTVEQRQAVHQHPARSAALLRACGVDDGLWLSVVEAHHAQASAPLPLASLAPADRLATLLQRVDVFLAKLSPRAGRRALLATAAARDGCIGPDGRPDQIGAAILRVLGFYPPGTWVRLASGGLAVVLRAGDRADQPLVASVADARRQVLQRPVVHGTDEPARGVQAACRGDEVRLPYAQELLWRLVPGSMAGTDAPLSKGLERGDVLST